MKSGKRKGKRRNKAMIYKLYNLTDEEIRIIEGGKENEKQGK